MIFDRFRRTKDEKDSPAAGDANAADGDQDAGSPDVGSPDAGPPDAGPPDAGPPDAGSLDAGAVTESSESAPTAAAASAGEAYEPHPEEEQIKESIVGVLRTIFDPEIPINIHEIGLIYDIRVDKESNASIQMTLTSPACPVAGSLPPEVEQKVAGAPGVSSCKVELVWDPPWGPHLLSEAARLQLNL